MISFLCSGREIKMLKYDEIKTKNGNETENMSMLYSHTFFVLMLNVPVNGFAVMSGQCHRFLGITSTFGE